MSALPKNALDPERAEWIIENCYADDAESLAEDWGEKPESRVLRMDWQTIEDDDEQFARQLLSHPEEAITCFQNALASMHKPLLDDAVLRFRNVPDRVTYRVGDLRTHHLRSLVAVECEVVDVDPVRPLMTRGAFECRRCGTLTYLSQSYGKIFEPQECQGCEESGPFSLLEEESTLIDHQPVVVTPLESSLEEPPVIPIYLTRDLVGRVGEDDELSVVGIYKTLPYSLQKETRLNVFLDANALNVDHRAKADKMTKSQLDTLIEEMVADLRDDDGGTYGASREAVIDEIASQHGVRRAEVEDRIDELNDSTVHSLSDVGGRVTVRD